MKIATIFKNGPSTQAVRIPKEFRLTTKEVWIEKIGECLVLKPKPESWDDFFNYPQTPSEDFSMEKNQQASQNRDDLFS